MKGFISTTCTQCGHGFNLVNPLIPVTDCGAKCPHCGQPTEADAEDLARARIERAAQPPVKPSPPWYPGSAGRPLA